MAAKRKKAFKAGKIFAFLGGMREEIIKRAVTLGIIVIFLAISAILINSFIRSSEYFMLRSVRSIGAIDPKIDRQIGEDILKMYSDKNILQIDLKLAAKHLATKYPNAKSVVVKRTLPDRLTVVINFRNAVAVIDGYKRRAVDDECVLLLAPNAEALDNLPVITGVSVSLDAESRKSSLKNLRFALDLLKELKRARFLNGYRITKIDAQDVRDLAFYLGEDLEIKIGYENYRDRINKLRSVLKDTRLVKDKIKYIDLRFDEVVIGPK